MLTAYRITRHLPPQSPLRLQQRNGLEPPLDATAQVLSGCPECPRAPDVKRQGNCPRPARLLLSPTRRENMPDGNSSVYPLPVTARSLARSPECHPRTWPRARERADTFFQTQNPHGVQGVDQRQAQPKPLAEGPGHRFQLVVAPGKLAVSGPRMAEGVDHGPLTLVRGGWKEDSRSPGPPRWVTA